MTDAPATPLRILMIDDESRILRALKALLREYTTFSTTNPLEAAALAKQHDVDVVICDGMQRTLGSACSCLTTFTRSRNWCCAIISALSMPSLRSIVSMPSRSTREKPFRFSTRLPSCDRPSLA